MAENGGKDPSDYLLDQAMRHAAGHPEHQHHDGGPGVGGVPQGFRTIRPEDLASFLAGQAAEAEKLERLQRRAAYRQFAINVGVSLLVTFTGTCSALYVFWHFLR